MHTQDYIRIARAIKATDMDGFSRSSLIDKLSVEFGEDNSDFNRSIFMEACTPSLCPIMVSTVCRCIRCQ